MRRRRTIYFNDARHYYLFIYDPPFRPEDAWAPIDEVAGTSVDTFIYGVSRDDGLFYPSKVGLRFGEGLDGFDLSAYWRVWHHMQSLIDRGLDPLKVLIDRAHEKGMDFFSSLRMGGLPGMPSGYSVPTEGRGYVHPEVRDHQFAVLEELATQYPVEGVELDFAAAPGGSAFCFKPEEASEHTSVMTDFVRRVAEMVHNRSGEPGLVGARVYPTEELNLKSGLDVHTWLSEGLVDFVVPMLYVDFYLDANMPIDWVVQPAHENEISVYAMLGPYYSDPNRKGSSTVHATPAMMRAAAANFWELDVDGLYTWFMEWPLGDVERSTLTELGDPELVKEADKHYFLRRRCESAGEHDYEAALPLEIPSADPEKCYQLPFSIADDIQNDRVQSVQLKINITNLMAVHQLEIFLNGESLAQELCRRTFPKRPDPYAGQWLAFDLEAARPQKGRNLLEIVLKEQPADFIAPLTVEDVEIIVQYGAYTRGL